MKGHRDILDYYKNELGWEPPFAEILGEYSPQGLKGYLEMREAVNEGSLDPKVRELIFVLLDSLDGEGEGAKAHARMAVEYGLSVKELVEAFMILTIVKGINPLCITGVEAIKAAKIREGELNDSK